MSHKTKFRAGKSKQEQLYPPDAFYAPLFKDNPKKIDKFLKFINNISVEEITPILTAISNTLSNKKLNSKFNEKLSTKTDIILLGDLIHSGNRCIGNTKDEKTMIKELRKLGLKNETIIEMIIKIIKKHNKLIQLNNLQSSISYPHYQDLQWRLDVTISSSSLKRVLKPSLVLSWTLSDGRIINIESSIEKFHELRFNVARVLREMQVLDQRFNPETTDEDRVLAKKQYNLFVSNRKSQISGINDLKKLMKEDVDEEETKLDK